jgi:protein TonB
MNRVSIFEKKWLDVIFEGKNQKYGAYQLRRENEKTTLIAFFTGIGLLAASVFLLSAFTVKPEPVVIPPVITDPLRVVDVILPKEPNVPKGSPAPKTLENPVKLYKPVPPALVPVEPEPIAPVVEPTTGPYNGTGTQGTPSGIPGASNTGGSTTGTTLPELPSTAIENSATLDVQPEFPGGLERFYHEIKTQFNPEAVGEDTQVRKVFVSFVIERNGVMTDIQILRNADQDVDREAIRVLNSIKIKWKAGVKNGQAVRSRFTIPITVNN